MLTFEQALSTVKEKLGEAQRDLKTETLPLRQTLRRFLAEDITADRDYPPFNRATRDGYAVRSAETGAAPVELECQGQVRAGESFSGQVGSGQCVRIMTGAPLPAGTDAVVMVEFSKQDGPRVEIQRAVEPWENVVRKGSEAVAGGVVLPKGRRLGAAELGLLAAVGVDRVGVFRQPRVAILPTGDEVVPVDRQPEWFQIRNSNAATLEAQATEAGAVPCCLPIAPDEKENLRRLIAQGLEADLLLLSGGVSMGEYDFVRAVLEELGAEFFFQGVAIRPGKPLVFGRVKEKFFFGLPGNPVSTFVTFELFVRPAIALLQSGEPESPVFLRARLGKPLKQKAGLTAFIPARLEHENLDPVVNLVGWQGSGDLVGVAAANCFLVVHPDQTDLTRGDWVDVLPKPS
jgi:molybdopterin molybdotransferase